MKDLIGFVAGAFSLHVVFLLLSTALGLRMQPKKKLYPWSYFMWNHSLHIIFYLVVIVIGLIINQTGLSVFAMIVLFCYLLAELFVWQSLRVIKKKM